MSLSIRTITDVVLVEACGKPERFYESRPEPQGTAARSFYDTTDDKELKPTT